MNNPASCPPQINPQILTSSVLQLFQFRYSRLVRFLLLAILVNFGAESNAQDFANKDEIVAASNMLHPPFSSWGPNKVAIGIEVDIVNAAAGAMGKKVKWIERPFPELFDAIVAGEIDVAVSTIGMTDDRMKKVAFSEPYYQTQIVALVKPDSKISSMKDLRSATIGADRSTTSFVAARKTFPNAKIVESAAEDSNWPSMVHNGTIDAFIVDASDKSRLESESGLTLKQLTRPLAQESFCVAIAKTSGRFKSELDSAIKKIKPFVDLRIGNEFQFTSPLDQAVYSLPSPPKKLIENYLAARQQLRDEDIESAIWYGRRAGYLLRMNEAIRIFTDAIKRFPNDPRLYRHRGHRYISTRQYELAIADLEKAASLIQGKSDAVEPDGAPNAENIPLTTTQGNIWYHLGLAYYLKHDMPRALKCFQERVDLEKYDDNYVANSHWIYMICRRLGKDQQAKQVVSRVNKQMRIIENMSYHRMCLFYDGQISEEDLGDSTDGTASSDVILYGLANWYLYEQNDPKKARQIFEKLFETGSPFSFAYIAAESDYVRLYK